jgi:hypothetical protein
MSRYDFYTCRTLLGKLQDIRCRTWCLFCRLMLSHIYDAPTPIQVEPDNEIVLEAWGRAFRYPDFDAGSGIAFAQRKDDKSSQSHLLTIIDEREIDISLLKKGLAACQAHHLVCSKISLCAQFWDGKTTKLPLLALMQVQGYQGFALALETYTIR